MKPPLPLVVAGAAGRMGRELVRTIQETPGVRLEAATELPGHASLGRDAGRLAGLDELGVPVRESLSAVLRPGRVLMDFTLATATEGHLAACIEAGTALVLGTTGHDDRQRQLITDAARRIPLMFAPNMSIGVNVCLKLLEAAAAMFGEEADVEILEMHHRDKLDAPSGTALEMGRVLERWDILALSSSSRPQ